MSISSVLYEALKAFDDYRRTMRNEFLSFKKEHERFKGSEGYNADLSEAKTKRKNAIEEARKNASSKIDECIKKMRENANGISFEAPTPEQVAILQVLSIKSKISKSELDTASKSMNGNPLALSALNDIADKHYYVGSPEGNTHENYNRLSTSLNSTELNNIIDSIVTACKSRLRTSVKDSAYQSAIFQKQHNNIPFDEDDLPQKDELTSESSFYSDVVPKEHFDSFMKAVNG